MHATIPALPQGIHQILKSGIDTGEANGKLADTLDRVQGKLLAKGMATAIKLAFGFLLSEGLSAGKRAKAQQFFEENFVMKDPNAEGGKRHYQGQILIRTKKPEDDMNVLICFCPDPDKLYTLIGRLNPAAIVTVETKSEKQAEKIEHDSEQCDLIIRFKDARAILGLIERPDADVVQLLLENLVQISGNFGHMFKFGAIGKSAQMMLID